MASGAHPVTGVAMRPVMDLSDRRVIAYQAIPRSSGTDASPAELLDLALAAASLTSPAPLLVWVDPRLLVSPSFDPVERARAAKCAPSEVIFVTPDPHRAASTVAHLPAPMLAAAVRRHCARLREAGFRIALDSVAVLSVSWEDVVAARPTFLLLDAALTAQLNADAQRAALVGLLAFAGRIGARLVAQGISTAAQAAALLQVGIFYGIGDHVHVPVVLDERLAIEGDAVVRPSWFRERAIRRLSMLEESSGVQYARTVPKAAVVDDSNLASFVTSCAGRLSTAETPDEVWATLTELLPQVVSFDRMAIFEADWDRYLLLPRVLIGEDLEPMAEATHTINTGITGWAFLEGVPYRCGRTIDHPEAVPIPGQDELEESMLVIPLVSGDRRLGVLDIWQDGADRYAEADLERAALVGRLVADAWRSAAERVDLAERVVTDKTTGLLNKRWWEELAPREAAQARRTESLIAVLMVDLDGFKAINDSHGHAAGDVVLNHVARALLATIRSGDAVIRYGGDEFILMLRDCDEHGAAEVASEVQLALTGVQLPAGTVAPLGASIGVAFFPDHGPTLADVAAQADVAMYQAKTSGGGRVVVYTPASGGRPARTLEGRAIGSTSRATLTDEAVGEVALGDDVPDGPDRTAQPSGTEMPPEDRDLSGWRHPATRVPTAPELEPLEPSEPETAPAEPAERAPLAHELTEQYRQLAYAEHLAHVGSFEMDLATGRMVWSNELRRIIGSDPEEEPTITGIIDRIHPDDLGAYGEAVTQWVEGGWGHLDVAIRLVSQDRAPRPARIRQLIHALDDGRRVLSGTIQESPEA